MGLACSRTEQGGDPVCAGARDEEREGAAAGSYALVWGGFLTTVANPFSSKKSPVSGQQVRQAKTSRGRRNVWALCVAPKGGGRGRKAHAQSGRPIRWVSTGLVFPTEMRTSSSAECGAETGKIPQSFRQFWDSFLISFEFKAPFAESWGTSNIMPSPT